MSSKSPSASSESEIRLRSDKRVHSSAAFRVLQCPAFCFRHVEGDHLPGGNLCKPLCNLSLQNGEIFPLYFMTKRLADHFTGVVVKSGSDFLLHKRLERSREIDVHPESKISMDGYSLSGRTPPTNR